MALYREMVSPKGISVSITTLMAVYVPLIFFIMTIGEYSIARELRPSDHGLEYQSMPPEESTEMMSFFKAPNTSNVALPKAMNSSNTSSWWNNVSVGGGGGGGGDHMRHVLLVASLVCGVTGVSLLVASGFIYLFRYKKQRSSSSSSSTNHAK